MLNKSDLLSIEELIRKNVKNTLQEFFETLILPYFEHNEEDHKEMKKILKKHDERFDSQDRDLDSIQRKLEKNEDDHEETFQRLDRIEVHVTNHEKRIRRVETVMSS